MGLVGSNEKQLENAASMCTACMWGLKRNSIATAADAPAAAAAAAAAAPTTTTTTTTTTTNLNPEP